ncbi:hypothetical protein IWW54_002369 [Coemansia sp. RSA 2705]|nr:hypothetical protein IWW54_002369 [Coemansia sp. RSA 2705]
MPKKQLSVGLPALLNLRAELERATKESRSSDAAPKRKQRLDDDVGVSNRGILARIQQDALAVKEDKLAHKHANARARQALEAKAKIYDALSGSGSASAAQLDESQLAKILEETSVDFVRRRQQLREQVQAEDAIDDPASDDSMVEIIDEFGRSRAVPRRQAKDFDHCSSSYSDSESYSSSASTGRHSAADTARRNHGASYFHLSSNYAQREEQLSMLRVLHSKTNEHRQAAAISIAELQTEQREHRQRFIKTSLETTQAKAL